MRPGVVRHHPNRDRRSRFPSNGRVAALRAHLTLSLRLLSTGFKRLRDHPRSQIACVQSYSAWTRSVQHCRTDSLAVGEYALTFASVGPGGPPKLVVPPRGMGRLP